MKRLVNILQEFSIPLIGGVIVALIVANLDVELYQLLVHTPLEDLLEALRNYGSQAADHATEAASHAVETVAHAADHAEEATGHAATQVSEHAAHAAGHGDAHGEDHGGAHHAYTSLHFLINDIFMVFFFGVAAKEITEACLPGGALNPMKKAINPLLGTLGGVLGPVGAFFILNGVMGKTGEGGWSNGWGIPTATDIALAWLIARMVFGKGHPAISFLLLLAVADDAIGLGIIAVAYPDPNMPTEWIKALWIFPGMAVAYGLRKMNIHSWLPYIFIGGSLSWYGLFSAHLHPALALVFIVPFLPGPKRDLGVFEEESDYDELEKEAKAHHEHAHTPLENFEHQLKLFVDFGLFFFAFANAGVPFAGITNLTWVIFLSLLLGKTIGITVFSGIGHLVGFSYPTGMTLKHVIVAGVVAGVGLTVALFVSGEAYTDMATQGAAKMGALFSGLIAFIAIGVGRLLGVKDGAK